MFSLSCRLRACLLAMFLLVPVSAQAIEIVVGGFRYDILFLTNNATIPDNFALVRSQPWYTGSSLPADRVLAQTFAQAYLAQAGTAPFDLDPDLFPHDSLLFIFDDDLISVGAALIDDRGDFVSSINVGFVPSPQIHYAYVSGAPVPVAVPEIDGNALANALFLLFTLYVWLQVRRDRRLAGHAQRD